ncbi:MAG TPA: preprotein translocase subunit YajC [Candidatus Tripitaka californicus]|uniref:preprotein translocase subunit YajC n=1 Tax=Candidatus Tripitaka californicus TaxID=3367616 RepID=UPI004024EDEF|nr:preprotein translocase subunit YajC [Planctomycetota bacterium]
MDFLMRPPEVDTPHWLVDLPIDSLSSLQVFLANLPCIGQAAQPPPVFWTTLLPIFMMGFVLYFFILRPQRQKERHRLDLLAGLKKNDRVITGGGLHGVVVSVKEKEVILQIDETKDVKVKVEKDAIISVEHREKHTESKEKHKEEG